MIDRFAEPVDVAAPDAESDVRTPAVAVPVDVDAPLAEASSVTFGASSRNSPYVAAAAFAAV